MRDDLKKQLCEHERFGSWDCYGNYRKMKDFADTDRFAAIDDEPFNGIIGGAAARESMKFRYGHHWAGTKEFGENLSPLQGIVRKAEGKQWDNVYSEICAVAGDRSSAVGAHIFQHLYDYIEVKTYIDDDGEIYFHSRYNGKPLHISSGVDFFVHPKTGCITRNKLTRSYKTMYRERREEEKVNELKTRRIINSKFELRKIGECWFAFEFIPTTEPMVTCDPGCAERIGQSERTQRWSGTYRRISAKRQLSRKELKQYNLLS